MSEISFLQFQAESVTQAVKCQLSVQPWRCYFTEERDWPGLLVNAWDLISKLLVLQWPVFSTDVLRYREGS